MRSLQTLGAVSVASAEKNPENTGLLLSRSWFFEFGPKEQNSHIAYRNMNASSQICLDRLKNLSRRILNVKWGHVDPR